MARRTAAPAPVLPTAPPPPDLQQQREKLALFAVNYARSQSGLPPLTALETPLQQRLPEKVADPAKEAAFIVAAGDKARGGRR
jgi:hypothetical protein